MKQVMMRKPSTKWTILGGNFLRTLAQLLISVHALHFDTNEMRKALKRVKTEGSMDEGYISFWQRR